MPTLVPVDHDPFAAPPMTLPEQPSSMPPGTVPGNMNAQPDVQTSMVPLSSDAERALRILRAQTMAGNRGGVAGAQDLLNADPTYQERKAQSTKLGDDAAARSQARRTGINILKSYATLKDSFDNADDSTLTRAIGPGIQNPYFQAGRRIVSGVLTAPMTIGAELAGKEFPVPYDASYNLNNLLHHDVHGLTNSFMTGGGKSLNLSDARQAAFDSTMADFMKATNRTEAQKVLDHAKGIISNDFGLTPEEADATISSHLNELRTLRQKDASAGNGQQPSNATPIDQNPVQQFRNKQTGAIESWRKVNGQWQQVQGAQ